MKCAYCDKSVGSYEIDGKTFFSHCEKCGKPFCGAHAGCCYQGHDLCAPCGVPGSKHGEVRNWREETTYSAGPECFDATTGESLGQIPGLSVTQSVSERWCAHCGVWVEVRGVMGALSFDINHEHGKEAK